MATLVLDRAELEIRRDGQALALYEHGERCGTVPIKLLERAVIHGNVRIETGVLARLAEAGVAVVLLSGRQSRQVGILLGAGHSDAAVRIAQCRLVGDDDWCNRWARHLVRRKIRAQARLVRAALDERADLRKPLSDAVDGLEHAMTALAGVEPAASARGIEGAAAAAYFRGLAALFPASVGFHGRNRRPPRDPVNACLSLGYTLLHFDAVAALHAAGLDPLIGFFHRPAFGRESLACDLVEPLRPRIDQWVWQMFRTRVLRTDGFVEDKGAVLLNKIGREKFYAMFERIAPDLRARLARESAVLVRLLRSRGLPLLDPIDSDEADE